MSETNRFAPKTTFALDPPKSDVYTPETLAKYNGTNSDKIYVAIKGTVFDVTRNHESYGPGKEYHVFAGRDASRALAKSSLKEEDAVAQYEDLNEKEQTVLDDWYKFFSMRYNVVGTVTRE